MNSEQFYRNLPIVDSFELASDSGNHADIPHDWVVVVADVMGSTVQIEKGNYKSVNTVGAMVIIGIVNINRDIEIPYIFGGDGATLAIPPVMMEDAKKSLLAIKELAKNSFGIDLRVGMVPVECIEAEQGRCRISKFHASSHITQSVFSGRGWEMAESLIKNPDRAKDFLVPEDGSIVAKGDFSGLECRWNSIPSFKDHKICILVQAMDSHPHQQYLIYQNVMKNIFAIYGESKDHHPIRSDLLSLTLNPFKLVNEAKVHCRTFGKRCKFILNSLLGNLAGKIIFKFGIDTKQVRWSKYVGDMIDNTDYRKFDGALKMVLDGSDQQKADLIKLLDRMKAKKEICFGIHTSNAVLMTCLIFSYNGNHAHFVDGADGGYSMAAKQLKKQLREFSRER